MTTGRINQVSILLLFQCCYMKKITHVFPRAAARAAARMGVCFLLFHNRKVLNKTFWYDIIGFVFVCVSIDSAYIYIGMILCITL